MLQSFNLCRSKLKINNLILYKYKISSYYFMQRNYASLSIIRVFPSKILYPSCFASIQRYNKTDSNSNNAKGSKIDNTVELTRAEKFKKAVKEYGTIVFVFHVAISLISLSICYVIVSADWDIEQGLRYIGVSEIITNQFRGKRGELLAVILLHKIFAPLRILITFCTVPILIPFLRKRGLDIESFFIWIGLTEDVTSKLATKTGTFVAAYAFHKMFAPVRISITLASAPLIVRYLRNIGWLKKSILKPIKNVMDGVEK